MFVGGKETTEIVFEEPPPLPPQSAIRLASVTTDAELAALDEDTKIWALQVKNSRAHDYVPSSAEMDTAAIVIQARTRGWSSRIITWAVLEKVLMVQRGCHRWVSRQILKKKHKAWLKRQAEEEAEAALKARYDALVNKGKRLGSNMNGIIDDMHKIIGANESKLKGTAGWTVYEKSRKKESDAALAMMTDATNEHTGSVELQYALDKYECCSVSDPLIIQAMKERIATRQRDEGSAFKEMRASVVQFEGQAKALVDQFEADINNPNLVAKNRGGNAAAAARRVKKDDRILVAGETRQWACMELIFQQGLRIDRAEEAKVLGLSDLDAARESHGVVL